MLFTILKSAVESGYIVKSPCLGVQLPRVKPREMMFLSASEVERLAEAASGVQNRTPEHSTLLYLLAYGGLRWGEAVALRRSRCDLLRSRIHVAESLADVGGTLHFGQTKTYETRAVVLPRFLREMLAQHLESVPADADALAFTSPTGAPLRHSNFWRRVWRPAIAAAGLPKRFRIHDLRHTCAALLISQGAHPKAIQAHLGHSSIQVTFDRYGHLFDSDMDALAERLDTVRANVSRPDRGLDEISASVAEVRNLG